MAEDKEQNTTQFFESLMTQAVKDNNKNKMTNRELDEYMVRITQLTRAFRLSAESNTQSPREAILVLLLALVEIHYTYTEMGSQIYKLEHLLELVAQAYINIGRINEN